jgi:rubrerythrin
MDRDRDYTTLEVLGIAIKSEVDAAKLYGRMRQQAKNTDLKEKLDFLASQEMRHREILTEAYNKKFPDTELKLPPKSIVPAISEILSKEASLKELFQVAMEAERLSENFYKDLAGRTSDPNSRSTLEYLASMEHSHSSILEVEYRQLELSEDYNSDDFLRGERLMNLGP